MTLFNRPDPGKPDTGTEAQAAKLARRNAANILNGPGGIGPRPLTSSNVLLSP
jgi:hypothetical protein